MYHSIFKRTLDLFLASILCVAFLPLFLIIAFLVRATSYGPALLVQPRMGRQGKRFGMLKFRSMYLDLDRQAYLMGNEGVLEKSDRDPRVTPLGSILRKFSLDELPQLLNVLKGDMSLVGPRPLLQFMVEPYPNEHQLRSQVRPGLTGLWQVSARNECNSLTQMIPYDLEYIEHVTFARDIKILLKTVPAVLSTKGAK